VIDAVGVVVPARDEEATVQRCLRRIRRALDRLPEPVDHSVVLIADRCADRTAELAEQVFAGWPAGQVLVNTRSRPLGELRDLGVRTALGALAGHRPDRIWLLSTDADSVVDPQWALAHLRHAAAGRRAVAGAADLLGHHRLPPVVRERYRRVLHAARIPEGHGNIYGANLGVRADAYLAVGGFHPLTTGEDRDLWHRLTAAGHPACHADDARVSTSARRHGRAPHGLADLLRSLEEPASAGSD
jgi:glycosyltransferase involved in cell wall biosynthesis